MKGYALAATIVGIAILLIVAARQDIPPPEALLPSDVAQSEYERDLRARLSLLADRDRAKMFPGLNADGTLREWEERIPPGVTLGNYHRLVTTLDMTYAEVAAILGGPGEEASRVDMAGFSTVVYTSTGADGIGNLIATFQNGALVSKAQAGLR